MKFGLIAAIFVAAFSQAPQMSSSSQIIGGRSNPNANMQYQNFDFGPSQRPTNSRVDIPNTDFRGQNQGFNQNQAIRQQRPKTPIVGRNTPNTNNDQFKNFYFRQTPSFPAQRFNFNSNGGNPQRYSQSFDRFTNNQRIEVRPYPNDQRSFESPRNKQQNRNHYDRIQEYDWRRNPQPQPERDFESYFSRRDFQPNYNRVPEMRGGRMDTKKRNFSADFLDRRNNMIERNNVNQYNNRQHQRDQERSRPFSNYNEGRYDDNQRRNVENQPFKNNNQQGNQRPIEPNFVHQQQYQRIPDFSPQYFDFKVPQQPKRQVFQSQPNPIYQQRSQRPEFNEPQQSRIQIDQRLPVPKPTPQPLQPQIQLPNQQIQPPKPQTQSLNQVNDFRMQQSQSNFNPQQNNFRPDSNIDRFNSNIANNEQKLANYVVLPKQNIDRPSNPVDVPNPWNFMPWNAVGQNLKNSNVPPQPKPQPQLQPFRF